MFGFVDIKQLIMHHYNHPHQCKPSWVLCLRPMSPLLLCFNFYCTFSVKSNNSSSFWIFHLVYMHAMQLGIKEAKGDPGAKRYLGTVMDKMEEVSALSVELT